MINRGEDQLEIPVATAAPGREAVAVTAPGDAFNPATYWRVVFRRWPQIVGLALAIGLLAGLVAQSLEPLYKASTTLLIDTSRRGFSPVDKDPAGGWYSFLAGQTYLETQILLLKSQALAQSVAERLDLWTHPEFDPRQEAPQRARFRLSLRGLLPDWFESDQDPAPISKEDAHRSVVEALAGQVQASVLPESEMIRVAVTSHDPELAARVAAAYADAYIEFGLETRLEQVKKAAGWLTGRLEGLRGQVDSSERKLQSYREQQGLVDVKSGLDLTDRELGDLAAQSIRFGEVFSGAGIFSLLEHFQGFVRRRFFINCFRGIENHFPYFGADPFFDRVRQVEISQFIQRKFCARGIHLHAGVFDD